MERLQLEDKIYMEMELDAGNGASILHSQEVRPSIHFVGQMVAD